MPKNSRLRILLGIFVVVNLSSLWFGYLYHTDKFPTLTAIFSWTDKTILEKSANIVKQLNATTTYKPSFVQENISDTKIALKHKVQEINRKQIIHNQDRHRFTVGPDTVVMFVQVHDRYTELGYLVDSLNKVLDIGKCLVVFSHDVYLEKVNLAITSAASFPYMQIFLPYSSQLYPNTFPGRDPNDCPKVVDQRFHHQKKCNNINFPDKNRHYREPILSQVKHHWVWKMNFVFEKIHVLKNFNGIFLRLEEDYYLAPDSVHVLRQMDSVRKEKLPSVHFMILGTDYEHITNNSTINVNIVRSRSWCMGSGRGMAFDRQFWEDVKTCADVFCKYDDYGWDWTLWKIVRHCMKQPVTVLEIVGSRVFHLGLCKGFHHHSACTPLDILNRITQVLERQNNSSFPANLKLEKGSEYCDRHKFHAFGGFADPRDTNLCLRLMRGQVEDAQKIVNDPGALLRTNH